MKPAYIGIILDDPEVLLRWWASHVGELLPKRIAHHMTIQFRPSADDMAALPIGEPVTLDVVGYAGDAEVQAVVVRPHGVRSTNRVPHVTVATDGYGSGLIPPSFPTARGTAIVTGSGVVARPTLPAASVASTRR